MSLRYLKESGSYTVMRDGVFIGRVRRWRSSYDHSNGRTYRSWSWGAYPVVGMGTDQLRTRAEAGRALERYASRHEHVDASEAARQSDLLPVPKGRTR